MVGAVTTLAGSRPGTTDGTGAAARFYSPWGVLVDGPRNLYVADSGNHTLRKVEMATGRGEPRSERSARSASRRATLAVEEDERGGRIRAGSTGRT